MRSSSIVRAVFFASGVILIIVCSSLLNDSSKFYRSSQTSQGEIVSYTKLLIPSRAGYQFVYLPNVSYKASNNKDYSFQASGGNSISDKRKIGDKITVYYQPSNPEMAKIKEEIATPSLLGLGLGLIFLLAALFSKIGNVKVLRT